MKFAAPYPGTSEFLKTMKRGERLDYTVATPRRPDVPTRPEWISPLNPTTFPRAEDDEETWAGSPEFHDRPDPGPDVGRGDVPEKRRRRQP